MGGYNTAVAGTTISAGTYNTYVRDQVISQFASTSARDSAITSPVNGMFCYTTDTGSLWRYNGSKWLLEPWTAEKTADQSWTSNTTLSDVAELSRAVDANAHYRFEWDLGVIATSTNGLQTSVSAPSGTGIRLDYGYYGLTYNTGAVANVWVQAGGASGGAGVFGQGLSNTSQAKISGVVAVGGTAGTFKIQAAQLVSGASSSWVLRGSVFTMRQVS